MEYQPSWVIQCQSYPCRRTVVVQFNTQQGADGRVYIFPKGISLKVNRIARLEIELAYYDDAVQVVSYYAKESFLVFDGNTLNYERMIIKEKQLQLLELLVFDKNTWNHITVKYIRIFRFEYFILFNCAQIDWIHFKV